MAEVLATASGVAGVASISFQLFEGCVKGFVLLSAAQGFGSRAEIFGCQLEWEHFHLHRWATLAGLFKKPPELNVLNHALVARTLRNLESILTNADKLQEQYGLKIEISEQELEAVNNSTHLLGQNVGGSAQDFISDTAKVFQKRTSSWKKLKWAAFSQNKFAFMLQDLGSFNTQLQSTLHWVEQSVYEGTNCDTLRSLIGRTKDKVKLDVVTQKLQNLDAALLAAACLKQRGLLLEILDYVPAAVEPLSNGSLATQPGSIWQKRRSATGDRLNPALQADISRLRRVSNAVAPDACHEVAEYDGRTVVLEWKHVPANMNRRLKHRIAAVANFLSDMTHSTFHSLPCAGYLREPKTTRYAYMFRPPLDVEFSMMTLVDLMQTPSTRPSINSRLKVAVAITETTLQLHTAGWLHKSIRSDNILFFQPVSTNLAELRALPDPYLGGYEFARLDKMTESTEAPGSYEAHLLYRHPLSFSQDRFPYCKPFDLYSLGCVLLEIGLWRPLLSLLLGWTRSTTANGTDACYCLPPHSNATAAPHDAAEWETIMQKKGKFVQSAQDGGVADELKFCMGEAYAGVVGRCLSAGAKVGQDEADGDEDTQASLMLEMECMKTLKALTECV